VDSVVLLTIITVALLMIVHTLAETIVSQMDYTEFATILLEECHDSWRFEGRDPYENKEFVNLGAL
jgi:hypothetical protein